MVDVNQQQNVPKSLYLLSVACVGFNLHKRPCDKHILRTLPDNVLMDIYYTMLIDGKICHLAIELGDLDLFARLLRELSARIRLLQCFQAVMDHRSNLAQDLSEQLSKRCAAVDPRRDEQSAVEIIQLGLRLGGFLGDAGWFVHSEEVLLAVRGLCQSCRQSEQMLHLTLQCCQRLLHTQSTFFRFESALETAALSTELARKVELACRMQNNKPTDATTTMDCPSTSDNSSNINNSIINKDCGGNVQQHNCVDGTKANTTKDSPDDESTNSHRVTADADEDETCSSTSSECCHHNGDFHGYRENENYSDAITQQQCQQQQQQQSDSSDNLNKFNKKPVATATGMTDGNKDGVDDRDRNLSGDDSNDADDSKSSAGDGEGVSHVTGGHERHLAALYAELSRLWFNRSDYDGSYQCSVTALRHLRSNVPAKVKIDVLRQAAKSCVVKRDFQKAGLLIRLAVFLAKEIFGPKHPKYSDALLDYGFYLLNVDSIAQSVKVYKDALDIKSAIFGKYNLHVAIAHEDLAYALYVHEYSSGRFYKARENAEKAIEIMQELVPSNHLMLASAKRVKALILEEIALDNIESELLLESEKLHLTALKLSTMAFGENNVQTAKHYGNLGRLYQSMKKFKEAESMHLKAIEIKEQLLGAEDYEVGLSIGHLASLYNYHMLQYREAETLYHRSIDISLKLFGETYSGLEYDYRGLVHVYHELDDNDRMWQYEETLNRWRQLRRDQAPNNGEIDIQEPVSMEDVTRKFFAMCK